ncbi:MAG: DNA topoisomerase I [Actinomycetota bacterium]|nr:DNA topoisomerase I [Actinomycetota bacterium]
MKLIISEKEIAAGRIAKILAGNGVSEEKVYGIPVYHFNLNGEDYKVIGLKGHIMKVDYPKEYANWFKVDPAELIDAEIEKVPAQKNIIRALKKVSGDADEIIVATDYDREGELIGYDAVQVVKENKHDEDAAVRRAKFSSITPGDINKAFSKPGKVDLNLAFAGRARQDIDLAWGATLTRFISLATFQVKDRFLSVGRVQTPTLTLIVDKELEIKSFVSTPYWTVSVKLMTEKGEEFEAVHKKKRFLKKEDARAVFSGIGDKGKVAGIKENIRNVRPPSPFNTTNLIISGSLLGFSASKTINIAEGLYMNGYISYPRTDNTVYPSSINLKEIVKVVGASGEYARMSEKVLAREKIVASRGKKRSTDHPPIYPVSAVDRSKMSSDAWKIYDLIVRRFLSTLMPAAKVKNINVHIDINGEDFVANGSNMLKANWIEFYPYYKRKDVFIPELKEGQVLNIKSKDLQDKETRPPSMYTQGKLVEKMEELGLGTKATRHTIIQNLIYRGYVNSNPLRPTEKAIAVVKMLKKHAGKISSPDMTSELEMYMDGIASGEETKEDVVKRSRKMLKEVMANLQNGRDEISREIKKGIREDLVVGKCPDKNCKGNLVVITSKKTKKRFIGCRAYPECRVTFPLPQKGLLITTKEVCKVCNYPIVKIIKKGRKPWNLCINPDCPGKDEKYRNYKGNKRSKKTSG